MNEIPAHILEASWPGTLEENSMQTIWAPIILSVEINVDQLQHLDLTRPITIIQEDE